MQVSSVEFFLDNFKSEPVKTSGGSTSHDQTDLWDFSKPDENVLRYNGQCHRHDNWWQTYLYVRLSLKPSFLYILTNDHIKENHVAYMKEATWPWFKRWSGISLWKLWYVPLSRRSCRLYQLWSPATFSCHAVAHHSFARPGVPN